MAQRQYDLTNNVRQEHEVTVGAGSSIGGSAVRITIDDANTRNILDAKKLLDIAVRRILKGGWPPA